MIGIPNYVNLRRKQFHIYMFSENKDVMTGHFYMLLGLNLQSPSVLLGPSGPGIETWNMSEQAS